MYVFPVLQAAENTVHLRRSKRRGWLGKYTKVADRVKQLQQGLTPIDMDPKKETSNVPLYLSATAWDKRVPVGGIVETRGLVESEY